MFSHDDRVLLLSDLECQAGWVEAQHGAQPPQRSEYAHVEESLGNPGTSLHALHGPRRLDSIGRAYQSPRY